MSTIHYLERPEGRLAYTDTGSGPLVVASPGMGDLRGTFRDLVPPLVEAGYRVVVMDLRGHGDSATTFTHLGDDATGSDLLALVEHLGYGVGSPVVLLGSSMGAASAVWAAAEAPDVVAGLVLLAPFVRNPGRTLPGWLTRTMYGTLLARPWGAKAWGRYYRSITTGRQTPWLDEHIASIEASLAEPGRLASFRRLAQVLDHGVVEARVDEVAAPSLSIVGTLDKDYPDPAAELDHVVGVLGAHARAERLLVADVGHYPHHQAPDVVVPAVLEFLASVVGADDGVDDSAPTGA